MRRRSGWLVVAVVCGVLAAACSNSPGESSNDDGDEAASTDNGDAADDEFVPVDQPGVTDSEIRVGGVASVTNPLDGPYGDAFLGVEAYFEMVNEEGGIYGRELNLVAQLDDQVAANDAMVNQLITQEDVFAVIPVASLLFTGADRLVDEGVPTFGWIINPEWEGSAEDPKPNLFGQAGSFLCFGCASPGNPYIADQIGASRIGLLAYQVPQSADCATGIERSFETYVEPGSAEVVYTDRALTYGTTDLSVQVSRMKDEGVDLILTCMDLQGVITLAREMNRQELDAVQVLPNGYDRGLLEEYGDLFQDSYVLTFFTPFEVEDKPEGLEQYLEWMDRTGHEPSENSMNGWLNAALFVEGLREAGPDFSRQKLVDAINSMTDWTADGLLEGVDWTTAHDTPERQVCGAYTKIEGDEFVPAFGEPGRPFVCLDRDAEGIPEATLTD